MGEVIESLTLNLVLQILQLGVGFVDHFVQLGVDVSVFLRQIFAQILLVGAKGGSVIDSAA